MKLGPQRREALPPTARRSAGVRHGGGVQGDPRLPISPDCLESGEFSLLLPGIEAEWYKGAVAVCPAWCDRTFRICL